MDDRKCYPCFGGPFAGHQLWLNTRATALLLVGKWFGRYTARKDNKTLFWESADAI